jgi:hypothetical protein
VTCGPLVWCSGSFSGCYMFYVHMVHSILVAVVERFLIQKCLTKKW